MTGSVRVCTTAERDVSATGEKATEEAQSRAASMSASKQDLGGEDGA